MGHLCSEAPPAAKGLSPHLQEGHRQAPRSYFLLSTGGCWGGIALLGVTGVPSSAGRPPAMSHTASAPLLPQVRIYTGSSPLGRVQVGPCAPGAGLLHWREMCSRGQLESARWHRIQPDALGPRPCPQPTGRACPGLSCPQERGKGGLQAWRGEVSAHTSLWENSGLHCQGWGSSGGERACVRWLQPWGEKRSRPLLRPPAGHSMPAPGASPEHPKPRLW